MLEHLQAKSVRADRDAPISSTVDSFISIIQLQQSISLSALNSPKWPEWPAGGPALPLAGLADILLAHAGPPM